MNRNDIKKILSSFANENQNISYRKFLKFVNSESSSRSEVIESRKVGGYVITYIYGH